MPVVLPPIRHLDDHRGWTAGAAHASARGHAVISVNNESMTHRHGMTVQDILDERKYIFRMLAVSVNGQIVARKDYGNTPVPDGAEVQVIHMISGG